MRMQKKTPDYDNVFKTMKMKHKRLFVSVINDVFGRNYPRDVKVEILPSEGYLTENETVDGSKEIEQQVSDFLIRIGSEIYLLECQSYDDGSMAIRIAVCFYRSQTVCNMGYWSCNNPKISPERRISMLKNQ